jgi:hypothetical protein
MAVVFRRNSIAVRAQEQEVAFIFYCQQSGSGPQAPQSWRLGARELVMARLAGRDQPPAFPIGGKGSSNSLMPIVSMP